MPPPETIGDFLIRRKFTSNHTWTGKKGVIIWILGTSLQWHECLKILDLVHLFAYCILSEDFAILMIKIDDLLNIPRILYSILIFDRVPLSLGRKYLGYTNEIIGIIGEVALSIPLGGLRRLSYLSYATRVSFSYSFMVCIGYHVSSTVFHITLNSQ